MRFIVTSVNVYVFMVKTYSQLFHFRASGQRSVNISETMPNHVINIFRLSPCSVKGHSLELKAIYIA